MTLLAVIAGSIWALGAVFIVWGMKDLISGDYGEILVMATLSLLWPALILIGVATTIIEMWKAERAGASSRPIDRQKLK